MVSPLVEHLQAVLAAVIMTAVIFSVEHHVILPIWTSKSKARTLRNYDNKFLPEIDLIPGFVCFFVALFYNLDLCIFAGTGVHLVSKTRIQSNHDHTSDHRPVRRGQTQG